jgi:sulfur carrier protein
MFKIREVAKMKLTVNGEKKVFQETSLSIQDVLRFSNVEKSDIVYVQLNDVFVPRNGFDLTKAKNGDRIDYLYFMGGGRKP